MTRMKQLLGLLKFHAHYWGIPHRNNEGVIVLTCYECSRSKPVRVDLEAR